jgi:hypothetical protein
MFVAVDHVVSRTNAAAGLWPLPTTRCPLRNEPYPPVELEPSPTRANHRRSRPPCHLRAISSGHERYAAVSHGHSESAVAMAARP